MPCDLAQVLGDLAAQFLIDLQDLQLDLGDLALGLGGRGDELAALAFEARRVALERRHALDLHEVLAPEIPDPLELLPDQLGLAFLRRHLTGEALDLLLELRDALPELCLLAGSCRAGGTRTGSAPRSCSGRRRDRSRERGAPPGKRMLSTLSRSASSRARRAWSSFRLFTTIARFACVIVSSSRTTMSPACTLSPSRTRSSPTTPPVGCWTFLTFEFDDEAAGRDHGARQLGRRRKPADPAGEKRHDRKAAKQMPADRPLRRGLQLLLIRFRSLGSQRP